MKTFLRLLCLVVSSLLPTFATAEEKSFPAKNPAFSYVEPEGWTSEVDEKNGSITISSADGNVAANFNTVNVGASMTLFKKMLPAMAKPLTDPKQLAEPKEDSNNGLDGYVATYTGTLQGKPTISVCLLFKAGSSRALIGDIMIVEPDKRPESDKDALNAFKKSMKAAVVAQTFPTDSPILHYDSPPDWTSETNKDGSLAITSPDGRISVNLRTIKSGATMALFKKMVPAMLKTLSDPTVVMEAKEQDSDGLSAFTSTYSAKLEGKPAAAIFSLIKGGSDRSVLAVIIAEDPKNLPKDEDQAMSKFMNSIKGMGTP